MRQQLKWIVGVLIGLLWLTAAFGQMASGSGRVLSSSTESPIEGAKVTLECRNQHIGIGHGGSGVIRTIVVTSDLDGTYNFSFLDVLGCSFAYVSAEKTGYLQASLVHTGYGYTNYAHIPKTYYLTPEADVAMLRLKYITPSQSGNVFRNGRYSAVDDYQQWYAGFFEAKRIIHTDQEAKFVRASYCPKLTKLYSLLSGDDKRYISTLSVSFYFRGEHASGKYDHNAEVVPYCTGSN